MRKSYYHYLSVVRHLAENTTAAYRRDLELFDRYLEVNGLDEESIDQRQARGFVGYLSEQGLSSRSINRVLSCLRGYYRFRQQFSEEGGPGNPFKALKSLKQELSLPSFLFEDEIATLLDRPVKDFWSARDLLLLEMLYSTGCRVAELVAINLMDLDFKEGSLRVIGKGKKERLVFVGARAKRAIKDYLLRRKAALTGLKSEPEAALFVNRRGGRLSVRGVQYILDRIVEASDLPKAVSPHTFRHSFATHILNRGGDIRVVQELLGHASLSTTQVYTHLELDRLKNVYRSAHPHARSQRRLYESRS